MSKELVKMCDCPEIQDKCKRESKSIYANIPNEKGSRNIVIPRIEDVLEWLDKPFWDNVMNAMLNYRYTDSAPASVWRDPLKSFIAYYMHLEHNKTWDGEAWV